MDLTTMTYAAGDRIARITLNRPERGNAITLQMPAELETCVERANLDPAVHAIALAGNGSGFCGGYDLTGSAEAWSEDPSAAEGSPIDPAVVAANHVPNSNWDPVGDFQMMSRNGRGFMGLFEAGKPGLCKVHGC